MKVRVAETWIGDHPHDGRQYEAQCARCGSSLEFDDCWQCGGEGYSHHECGEDSCHCRYPEDNVECDICDGKGTFPVCLSSRRWCQEHPLPGRENIKSSTPEWWVVA